LSCAKSNQGKQEPNLTQAAVFNQQLGAAYLKENDFEHAAEKLMLAKKQNSQSADILLSIAYLFQKQHQNTLAQSYYEQAFSLAPDDSKVLNNFGAFLCWRGNYKKGLDFLSKARVNIKTLNSQSVDENLKICKELIDDT
jgi:type IV pilus assembly protein PilF